MKISRLCIILAAAALLPFLPNAKDFFVGDDFCLLEQSRVFTWQAFFSTGPASYLRPIPLLAYHLLGAAFGLRPLCFHLASILLHLMNVLLLFILFHRYSENKTAVALMGLGFAWHFSHAEAVIWISSLNELLVTAFGLLFLLAFLISSEQRARWGILYIASLIFLALALFSKENAVILPFVALGMLFLDKARSKKKAFLLLSTHLFLVFGFICLRGSLGAAMPTWNVGKQGEFFLSPLIILSNFGHFLVSLLIPLRFIFDLTGYEAYERLTYLGAWNSLLFLGLFIALFSLVFLVVLLAKLLRPGREIWTGVLWVGIALLPYVFFSGKGERFLYFVSAGACLVMGSLLASCIEKRRKLGIMLAGFLFCMSLGICYERGRWWSQSGRVTEGVLLELKRVAPSRSPILILNVPQRIHGAYVFTTCFGSALRLFLPSFSREVQLAGREDQKEFPTSHLGAEIYLWKEGHLVWTEYTP